MTGKEILGWTALVLVVVAIIVLGISQGQPPPLAVQENRICRSHGGAGPVNNVDDELTVTCRDGHVGELEQ
jgi:hypothetical protein